MESFCYHQTVFSLIPRKRGKERGWIIDGFDLSQTDTLEVPDTYEGLPILGLFERPYISAYPQIKRVLLGRELRELHLHDGCFPSLEELRVKEEGSFLAEGTRLYSREGKLLFCLGGIKEGEALLPWGEGKDCLEEEPAFVGGCEGSKNTKSALEPSRDVETKLLEEPAFVGGCKAGENTNTALEPSWQIESEFPEETKDLVIKKDTLIFVSTPLDTLVLPKSVRKIGPKAFCEHAPRRIESFSLIEGEGEKPLYDFPGVSSVRELVIKGEGETLKLDRLLLWPALEKVHLPFGTRTLLSREGILYSRDGRTLVFFPPNHPFAQTNFHVPEKVEKIGERAFARSQITQVEMDDQVTEIGRDAFLGCEKLERVWLSDSIEELPGSGLHARYVYLAGVFGGCKSLSCLHLPKALKRIGANAFFQSGISRVQLPQGLEEIGVRAFYGTKIEEIQLPPSVRSVGRDAFLGEVKRIIAREGSARGLLLSVSSGKGQVVWVRVLPGGQEKMPFSLPVPVNFRGALGDLLLKVWDGEAIDWEAYAQCALKVRDEELKLFLSFLAALHLDKKRAAPLKKNISGKELLLGELIIRQEEPQLLSLYLKLLGPSRKVVDALLQLCNQEGWQAFIPVLLEENKGKNPEHSWQI